MESHNSCVASTFSTTKPYAPIGAPRLFLANHAHICRVRRHWIILDITRDNYYCIPARDFDSLGPLIHGWPSVAPVTASASGYTSDSASEVVFDLIAKGVLTEDPTSARKLSPSSIPAAVSVLETDNLAIPHRCGPSQVAAFVYSCAIADRRLCARSFSSIIKAVEARRVEQTPRAPNTALTTIGSLITAFNGLRLWYPRAYLCLFDSLALLEFLARHRIYPRWTFGVMADPFFAHCWLQDGSVVLNDVMSRVAGYTPIMSV